MTGMDWCTRTATSALASEVNATSPSIPAVLRPALRCVTCRTLTSVLAWLCSISLCRFLTRGQSCSCVALKIRCRSRRTCSSCSRQSMLSHQVVGAVVRVGLVFRSVHVVQACHRYRERMSGHRCPTCPSVPVVSCCSSSSAHLPTSARFRAQAPGPVSGQLCAAPGGGAGQYCRVFLLPFGRRRSLLGHPVPPRASAPLAIGLPRCDQRGPWRGFRVPHARDPAGIGCPLYPGDDGAEHGQAQSLTAASRLPTAGPCHPGTADRPGMCN